MEYLDQNLSESGPDADEIQVTRSMRQRWYSISRWAFFFAITGFVVTGMSLLGIGTLANLPSMMEYAMGDSPVMDAMASLGAGLIGIFILLFAFQLLVNYWQLRFASQMKRAITYTDQEAFESSWVNLRNFFRAIGIVTLVGMLMIVGLLMVAYTMFA